ncbi:MAG: hypothetical protein KDC24_09460 [Saprospiraceae bacterium]|nr:hypothetical protein [Saprospiraceae bacterium]
MSTTTDTFPTLFALNGSDYFQVILDRHHRKYSKMGNVCRLGIFVDGVIDAEKWEKKVTQDSILQWMSGLRLRKVLPFQLPAWKSKGVQTPIWQVHTTDIGHDLPLDLYYRDINPYKNCPIRFDLVVGKDNKSTLLITWSHVLMDSHGAELLLQYLHNGQAAFPLQLLPKTEEELPIKEQIQKAKEVKNFLLDGNQTLLDNLQEQPRTIKGSQYRIIRFSEEETEQIAAYSKELKIRLGQSPLLLGASIRGFDYLMQKRGVQCKSFWVPIPQDQRRKGANGPLIGNQVSYLFYRLFPKDVNSLADIVSEINRQMMDQMRQRIPASYNTMMHLSRRLPYWLFEWITKRPTKGKLSSFFFSDTGTLLSGMETFEGMPFKDVIHYPPNPSIPGITVVFSIFQKKLQAIVAFAPGSVSEDDLENLKAFLRKELIKG